MATPVLTNIWKVGFRFEGGGHYAAIVLGISSTAASATALHALINGAVTSTMWASVPTGFRVATVRYFKLDGVTPTQDITTVGTNWDGSGGTGEIIPAVAALVSLKTADRGPHARGRLYLPCTSEAVAGQGYLSGATRTTLQTAWDTFRNAMVTANAPMQVVSYGNLDNVPPPAVAHAPAARAVQSVTVQSPLATQRRRQDRLR